MQSASGYFAVASPGNSVYSWFFDVYTSTGGTDQIQIYEQWTTPTGSWASWTNKSGGGSGI
jgi:hypothetical protein